MENESRKQNAVRNLIFGLINKCILLIAPFFILLLIKKNLGVEYLGLNNLFTSIIQMLCLADIGIGNAMVYEMYKPASKKNYKELSSLLNVYKKIYFILSLIILLIGICLIPFLDVLIKGTLPESTNIYLLFIIYLFNTFISYCLFSYKRSILQVFQRNDILSNINTICNIIVYFIQIILLIYFKNYYLYVLTFVLLTIIDNISVHYITKKKYPEIKPEGTIENDVKTDITKRVSALAGHKIGAVVISSLDSIVISIFLGISTLAIYSNYFYIVKALNGVLNIGFNSVLPGIGNSLVIESEEANKELFYKLSFMLISFVSFCSVCLFILLQSFMKLWMGADFLLPFYTMILFVIYFYSWQFRIIGLAFKDAAGMWKDDAMKPYIGLIVNLILNIILVQVIGINGILISTIIVMFFIYFPWETHVLFKSLFKSDTKEYIKNVILNIIFTVFVAILTHLILSNLSINLYLDIAIRLITTVIIYTILFIVFYSNNKYFKYYLNEIKTFIQKRGLMLAKQKR